jgi:two-component system phosphate regulon response regulator PhoB/two-component system alkaline phosphatase synthesis response regulator PhoP
LPKLIAVVDDEPDILELVSIHLEKAGYQSVEFSNGESFLEFLKCSQPELIVLDLMLPDMNGLEICKYLKKHDSLSSIPIIMLTAKSEEIDKILGLELGADDYVTKPFSPKELIARIRAVLRRNYERDNTEVLSAAGILTIDTDKHEVRVRSRKVKLTPTEFRILQLLASKKGWVFSREKILDYLWGQEKAVVDRTVDVHINHLREKLGEAASLIINIRGVGYKLEE